MSMKAMNDIREMLCDELDEVSRHGTLNVRDLDVVYKVTQSIANLDDIMEEEGYSHDGGWEAKMRGTYGNDMRRDRRYADDTRAGWIPTKMTVNLNTAIRRICAEQGGVKLERAYI